MTQSSRRGTDGVGLPGRTSRPGASESGDEIPVGVCLKAFKRPRTPSESATLTGVWNAYSPVSRQVTRNLMVLLPAGILSLLFLPHTPLGLGLGIILVGIVGFVLALSGAPR